MESRELALKALVGHDLLGLAAEAVSDECPLVEDEEEPLPQLSRLWTRPLDWLDCELSKKVATSAPVGFPTQVGPELGPDAQAALLAVYAGQFGSYTTLLWQVPALRAC
jgi:hypothetical protein